MRNTFILKCLSWWKTPADVAEILEWDHSKSIEEFQMVLLRFQNWFWIILRKQKQSLVCRPFGKLHFQPPPSPALSSSVKSLFSFFQQAFNLSINAEVKNLRTLHSCNAISDHLFIRQGNPLVDDFVKSPQPVFVATCCFKIREILRARLLVARCL